MGRRRPQECGTQHLNETYSMLSPSVLILVHDECRGGCLCFSGLIEYLNKPINHWNSYKTDRSGEVMFIKPLNLFFNPYSNLFAE